MATTPPPGPQAFYDRLIRELHASPGSRMPPLRTASAWRLCRPVRPARDRGKIYPTDAEPAQRHRRERQRRLFRHPRHQAARRPDVCRGRRRHQIARRGRQRRVRPEVFRQRKRGRPADSHRHQTTASCSARGARSWASPPRADVRPVQQPNAEEFGFYVPFHSPVSVRATRPGLAAIRHRGRAPARPQQRRVGRDSPATRGQSRETPTSRSISSARRGKTRTVLSPKTGSSPPCFRSSVASPLCSRRSASMV